MSVTDLKHEEEQRTQMGYSPPQQPIQLVAPAPPAPTLGNPTTLGR